MNNVQNPLYVYANGAVYDTVQPDMSDDYLVVDPDDMSSINDALKHFKGDQWFSVLQEVAEHIATNIEALYSAPEIDVNQA